MEEIEFLRVRQLVSLSVSKREPTNQLKFWNFLYVKDTQTTENIWQLRCAV